MILEMGMRTAVVTLVLGLSFPVLLAQAQPTATPTRQSTKAPTPKATAPAPPRPAPTRATMTVMVTDRQGDPLAGVAVGVTGPVERDATTDAEGNVSFRNMGAGTYRLRFEHPAFITLERELSMQAGRTLRTSAALNKAPSPPPTPEPAAVPTPATPQLPPPGSQPATSLSIPDVFEANTIGRVRPKRQRSGARVSRRRR